MSGTALPCFQSGTLRNSGFKFHASAGSAEVRAVDLADSEEGQCRAVGKGDRRIAVDGGRAAEHGGDARRVFVREEYPVARGLIKVADSVRTAADAGIADELRARAEAGQR